MGKKQPLTNQQLTNQQLTLNEAKVIALMRECSLCEQCNDMRGGAIGNGQLIAGRVLCDYCHADWMKERDALKRKPKAISEADAIRLDQTDKFR